MCPESCKIVSSNLRRNINTLLWMVFWHIFTYKLGYHVSSSTRKDHIH